MVDVTLIVGLESVQGVRDGRAGRDRPAAIAQVTLALPSLAPLAAAVLLAGWTRPRTAGVA